MNTERFDPAVCRDRDGGKCIFVDHDGRRWEADLFGKQLGTHGDYIIRYNGRLAAPMGKMSRLENLPSEEPDFPSEIVIELDMDDLKELSNRRNGFSSVWAYRTDHPERCERGRVRLTLAVPASAYDRLRPVPNPAVHPSVPSVSSVVDPGTETP